jgi:hypothetical protein
LSRLKIEMPDEVLSRPHPAIAFKRFGDDHGPNGLSIFEKAQLLCEMPLQTGEANPWFGQLPLSRATDHIESRVM